VGNISLLLVADVRRGMGGWPMDGICRGRFVRSRMAHQ